MWLVIPDNLEVELQGNPLSWNEQTLWLEVGRKEGWLMLDADPKYSYQFKLGKKFMQDRFDITLMGSLELRLGLVR